MKLEFDIESSLENWKYIGDVSIETGRLLLIDPCFVGDGQGVTQDKMNELFTEFTNILIDKGLYPSSNGENIRQIARDNDHLRVRYGQIDVNGGMCVVSTTGMGDGRYPVYARVEYDATFQTSRVVGLWVDFLCGEHLPNQN